MYEYIILYITDTTDSANKTKKSSNDSIIIMLKWIMIMILHIMIMILCR